MKKIILLTILLSLLTAKSAVFAQDNPFISKKPDKRIEKSIQYPHFMQKILKKISVLQHRLNQRLSELAKEIKEKNSKKSIFIIILITFIYGMIHAIGPGHGKTITFSYFLSERADIKKGIIVGSFIGFLHAGSALIIVLILYFIIKQSFLRSFEDLSRIIKLVSYGLIMLIGLFLLVKALINLRRQRNSKEKNGYNALNTKSIIPFSIAVGIVPCPGAMIILLFSLSLGILSIGIISTFFMALGMATTISLVGILTIVTKQRILRFVSEKSKNRAIFQTGISIIGSSLILFLGILLLAGTI
ncbi:hypothetical protein KAW18_05650 [candidate division WOR-3 bacterium]|nr:hypothetical protein [candidate division WOR-3 bacterium]MCK4526837.1 hypothetical protein [candidate division WOR-3 bacterium]